MKRTLDFLIIGAAKAGTTSLFEYLRPHPQLRLPAAKEFPFFSDDRVYGQGLESYLHHAFGDAPSDALWGTVTPQYMAGCIRRETSSSEPLDGDDQTRAIPQRILRDLPDVRLVAILRDPVERFISHYRMDVLRQRESRSLEILVDELLQPSALEAARRDYTPGSASYVTLGEYGRILQGYYDVFDAQQVCVTFTSDLAREPKATLSTILEHLGADPEFEPPNLGVRYLQASSGKRVQWLDVPRLTAAVASQRQARAIWHRLPSNVRWWIERRRSELARRAVEWNRRTEIESERLDAGALQRLRDHYRGDGQRLHELIGRAPPWARTADAGQVRGSAH